MSLNGHPYVRHVFVLAISPIYIVTLLKQRSCFLYPVVPSSSKMKKGNDRERKTEGGEELGREVKKIKEKRREEKKSKCRKTENRRNQVQDKAPLRSTPPKSLK